MSLNQRGRDAQLQILNQGWRIPWISPSEDGKPYTASSKSWAGRLAPLGVLGFMAGIGWTIYAKKSGGDLTNGLYLAGTSFGIALILLFIENRNRKKGWRSSKAKCLDKEVIEMVGKAGSGRTWGARILCEIEHGDRTYQNTPQVHWSSFRSEDQAMEFLNSRIDSDGNCMLRLNPANPLEAELLAESSERVS